MKALTLIKMIIDQSSRRLSTTERQETGTGDIVHEQPTFIVALFRIVWINHSGNKALLISVR